MERLEYDLLFRWFVGIGVDAAVWDHSVFSKNRDRLLEGDIAARFLVAVLDQPRVKKLLSTDHVARADCTPVSAPILSCASNHSRPSNSAKAEIVWSGP
jgi:Transposase domain (DUF772)